MASVKIKFRPSSVAGKEGKLYLQVICNRKVKQITTKYRLFPDEWDAENEYIILLKASSQRYNHLRYISERITWDKERLEKIISEYDDVGTPYDLKNLDTALQQKKQQANTLCAFMHEVIAQLKLLGRERTAETYISALRSFLAFRDGNDMPLSAITSETALQYEAYLKARGVTMNTISFYMRILRATYNRAVEQEIIEQRNPFRHVYTGVDKTIKRAIPIKAIKKIKKLDLTLQPSLAFARDMFLFSFYTRGMSFVDMAFLKKSDVKNGVLTYRRRKTGQTLLIGWEKSMQSIVDRYSSKASLYLLPIIKRTGNERTQYKNALHLVNNRLKEVARLVGLQEPLTMYVARHSWASAAREKNVSLSVISEGMGHDSETTTQIYLASLDTSLIDEANKTILDSL